MYIGFEFNAIKDSKSKWPTMYGSIAKGLSDHKYYIFPVLDQSLLWLFPKRKLLHQHLDEFLSVMDEIILHKRELIKNSKNKNNDLEENEKDFLTLMIESELRGEGAMSNEELKVCLINLFCNAIINVKIGQPMSFLCCWYVTPVAFFFFKKKK